MTRDTPPSAQELGLPDPYGSAPSRPARHVLYIQWANDPDRRIVLIYAALYAARKCLDMLFDGDEIERISSHHIRSTQGIIVKSETLDEYLNHEYTKAEAKWVMSSPEDRAIISFRTKSTYEHQSDKEYMPEPGEMPKRREPEGQVPTQRKSRKHRASRDGLITIGDIATQFKLKARDARDILRKAKIDNPDSGWAWSEGDVDRIKAIIKEGTK